MAKQNFEIVGTVHKIGEREVKSEKLTVRTLVAEIEDGKYKQYVFFQASNDRCDLLDFLKENQEVKIHFSIQGRAWQDKFFNTLSIWKIEATNTSNGLEPPVSQPQQAAASDEQGDLPTDTLPF